MESVVLEFEETQNEEIIYLPETQALIEQEIECARFLEPTE